MTAEAIPDPEPSWTAPAARLGYEDASRLITAQYAAGVDLDALSAHHSDVAAGLLSDARTEPGRAYADSYSLTAGSLIADLRQDAAAAQQQPEPPGTPHPDARLASRGWQRCEHGIYVRREPQNELEAGE